MTSYIVRALAAALLLTTLVGCQQHPGPSAGTEPIFDQKAPNMDLAQLPTLKETQTQMLGLLDTIQREISALVPALKPWQWHYDWTNLHCATGIDLHFPKLVSSHALSEDEWQSVLPVVTGLAAQAGITADGAFQNAPGNHDVRFSSPDGRGLVFGSREATLLTGNTGCRRTDGESVWVDGQIPMPPNPEP